MKTKILYLIIFISTMIQAQTPSDSQLKTKIKEKFKGAESIVLEGKGSTEKVFEDGVWKYYYNRYFHTTYKNPNYPKITAIVYNSIRYLKVGNRYVFNNISNRGTEMKGLDKPKIEEVRKLLKSDMYKFVGHNNYNNIVGELSEINYKPNTYFKWEDVDHVEFLIELEYSEKTSNNELQKAKHFYEVHLYSDGLKKPWKKFLAFEQSDNKEIISKRNLSETEINSLRTLSEIDEDNKANTALKELPRVEEPPVFQTDKQLFYFIHNKLMTSAPKEAKAYLYKILSKKLFERKNILNTREKEWIDRLIDNLKAYQNTYCQYPKVKEEQEGSITFYDKDRYRSTRMRAYAEDGTWKLSLIYFIPPSQDEINKLAKMTGDCSTKPDLEVKKQIVYNIGDIADVKFSNGIFAGEITKKDTNFDNRYYVKLLDGGQGYWVNDDVLTPSSVKKVTFTVGDKVGVKFRNGTMPGTIQEINGDEFLIKFDDSGYKDMWVAKHQVEKK